MNITKAKRISGNCLEKALILRMPIFLLWAAVMIAIKYSELKGIAVFMLTVTIVLTLFTFLFDTCIALSIKVKTLQIDQDIHFGSLSFKPSQVSKITPITIHFGKIDFSVIEFSVINNSTTEQLLVMPKPRTFVQILSGKRSKTYQLLFDAFPQLEGKLKKKKRA